jgi:hypothetical protein
LPQQGLAQACVSPALADTLVRVRYAETGASAYWLSRQQLQWPGAPADGRYALYKSAGATLQVARGAAVEGADARIPLARDPSTRADVAQRFRFIAAGCA